jgi:glutamyl-tRNA synthetase
VKKNLLKDSRLREWLPELADKLGELPEFAPALTEQLFRWYAEEKGIAAGLLINAVRTAVSGTSVGPGLFEMLNALGKERVVRRLRKAPDLVPVESN